ncbi:hypothetical protein P3T73_14810 [Kiritimatiellota bacterium B12222]|nr:hypothetical protein P3T73_14810 [Kiritimatiellota bacterium B12222]
MKTVIPKPLALLSFLMTLATANAQLPLTVGETIIFNETFTDNQNEWSNVAIVNGKGTASSKQAKIENGIWTPSIDSDGSGVSSTTTFEALDLSKGPLSIYMLVNIEDILNNPAQARFGIDLTGKGGTYSSKFVFQIEPGDGLAKQFSYLQYRNEEGAGVTDNLDKTHATGIITDPQAFYSFKLTITHAVDGFANIQAYYYDAQRATYFPFPSETHGTNSVLATTGKGEDKGLFTSLTLSSRNGSSNASGSNAAKFKQVVITQTTP